jgi:hypothetical protein
MARNKIHKGALLLDNNFEVIDNPDKASFGKDDLRAYKIYTYQKGLRGKPTKPQNVKYHIVKSGKEVILTEKYFNALQKKRKRTAEEIFDKAVKSNPDELKINLSKSRWERLKGIGIFLTILLLVGAIAGYFYLTDKKNFSDEIIVFDANSSISMGDYVNTDIFILDAYGIEVLETTSVYGFETSADTSKGNLYILGAHLNESNLETFIYRTSPDSEVAETFNSLGNDEWILTDVQGEVRSLGRIETMDEGIQIEDYFNSTIRSINQEIENENAFEYPVYFIDGLVTQASFTPIIIFEGVMGGLLAVSLVATLFFWNKDRKYFKEFVEKF